MPARNGPPGLTVRPAVSSDVDALKAFKCSNDGEPWTIAPELIVRMQVPAWIGVDGASVTVAELGGEIVGVNAMTVVPNNSTMYLNQVLAVSPAHRRKYVGYTLKLLATETAVAAGGELISSEVDVDNVAMRKCNDCFSAEVATEPGDAETLIAVVRAVS